MNNWSEQTTTMINGWADMQKQWWGSWFDAYAQNVSQLLDSPTLGYTREYEEKWRRGLKLWPEYQQASFEYQTVIGDAWVLAFTRLGEKLVAISAEGGEPITGLQQLADLWSQVADSAFTEIFHSEKYIHAQGKLANATMAYRIQQREMVESFSRFYDIPTRTEVDEAHRANYQQRREIRVLKRDLAAAQAQMATLTEAVARLSSPNMAQPAAERTPRKKAAATTV